MRRLQFTAFVSGFAVALIGGYGLFEARRLIEGPVITIEYPIDGSATSSTGVIIAGDGPKYIVFDHQRPPFLHRQKRTF